MRCDLLGVAAAVVTLFMKPAAEVEELVCNCLDMIWFLEDGLLGINDGVGCGNIMEVVEVVELSSFFNSNK